MADALISPAVGGVMFAASAGLTVYSARRIGQRADDRLVPLMGVTGAFVFAAQMINFGIPGTGSSGHLGGGLLLAALLGPYAAFLVMTSILVVQALFFADGGLLALGCNVFNLGALPCFIAYPLIFRPLVSRGPSPARLIASSILAAVVGLQMGSMAVVLQTVLSGRTELPFTAFLWVMQPIHLAIGIVEGLATAGVLAFIWKARPQLQPSKELADSQLGFPPRAAWGFLLATLFLGGIASGFASQDPDGLEWSIEQTAGTPELSSSTAVHDRIEQLQLSASPMPDYDFPATGDSDESEFEPESVDAIESWPAVNAGVSTAGVCGSLLVLLMATSIGYVSRRAASTVTQT